MAWDGFSLAVTWHADLHAKPSIIERPDDLTASWLSDKIGAGAVADFAVERIGTGQMSECYRVAAARMPTPAQTVRPGHVRWC